MLSAEELMKMRASKAHPKPLPSMPPKEFVPSHSKEETEAIHSMVDENLTYLSEQRAEKKNLLTKAEWLPNDRVAQVEHKVGSGWDAFGFDSNSKTFLQPEEALFLLENSRLELWFSGTPVSVQQAYQILLTNELCSIAKYRVYSHLCRQGYRLVRRKSVQDMPKRTGDSIKASSPKRAKIESSTSDLEVEESQLASSKAALCHRTKSFRLPAALSSDYDCIPHLVPGLNSIQVKFVDHLLLPETSRNREAEYVISLKNLSQPEVRLTENDVMEGVHPDNDPASSFSVDNNPLYSGRTKPLRIGKFIGEPGYSSLGLYNFENEEDDETNDIDVEFCYSVYSPGRHFRKSNPGKPCYILAIANWNSSPPSFKDLERYSKKCDPESTPLIAITGTGSGVSYYQLKGIVSPL